MPKVNTGSKKMTRRKFWGGSAGNLSRAIKHLGPSSGAGPRGCRLPGGDEVYRGISTGCLPFPHTSSSVAATGTATVGVAPRRVAGARTLFFHAGGPFPAVLEPFPGRDGCASVTCDIKAKKALFNGFNDATSVPTPAEAAPDGASPPRAQADGIFLQPFSSIHRDLGRGDPPRHGGQWDGGQPGATPHARGPPRIS